MKAAMHGVKKFALITGASSGIGLAFSRELGRLGYPLLMVSNEEEKLNAAALEIQSEYKVKAMPLCMDLAQNDSAQKLFDYCEGNNIQIEILINNAGIFFFRDVMNTTLDLVEKTINLHVYTPTMLSALFAKQMIRQNREPFRQSYILNIASIAARMMMPGIALYSATKSYLHCFSRAMRHEAFERGISITTVCPGAIATGLYGLAPRYMKLGLRLGVILTPERLASKAIKKMFQRKAEYVPGGFINRLFVFIINVLPEPLVRSIKRKIDKLSSRS